MKKKDMQNSGLPKLLRWRTQPARTNSGHLRLCQQPRAAHALHLDQLFNYIFGKHGSALHYYHIHQALYKGIMGFSCRIKRVLAAFPPEIDSKR